MQAAHACLHTCSHLHAPSPPSNAPAARTRPNELSHLFSCKPQARIKAAGGRIVFNGGTSRVQGMLAMSRAIGDHFLRPYVIADPEVNCSRVPAPGCRQKKKRGEQGGCRCREPCPRSDWHLDPALLLCHAHSQRMTSYINACKRSLLPCSCAQTLKGSCILNAPLPQVVCVERTEQDEVLVLATDGLWDVFSCKVRCAWMP